MGHDDFFTTCKAEKCPLMASRVEGFKKYESLLNGDVPHPKDTENKRERFLEFLRDSSKINWACFCFGPFFKTYHFYSFFG